MAAAAVGSRLGGVGSRHEPAARLWEQHIIQMHVPLCVVLPAGRGPGAAEQQSSRAAEQQRMGPMS
jgi:hypothetical protein